MLRTSIEKLTRPLRYKRKFSNRFGRNSIWVSPSVGLKYLKVWQDLECVDPNLLSWVEEFISKESVVWDIGANVGLFSFAAANAVGSGGTILAVEPDTSLVDLLRSSAAIQQDTSAEVIVLPVAVGDSVDVRSFCIATRSRAASHLLGHGSTQTGGVSQQQTVVTVSLDWLSERFGLPDVIKIDVEGAEAQVLRGGVSLLAEKRPTIICEASSEASVEVTEQLLNLKYRIFDGDVASQERVPLSMATWSTIAVPSEKLYVGRHGTPSPR